MVLHPTNTYKTVSNVEYGWGGMGAHTVREGPGGQRLYTREGGLSNNVPASMNLFLLLLLLRAVLAVQSAATLLPYCRPGYSPCAVSAYPDVPLLYTHWHTFRLVCPPPANFSHFLSTRQCTL